LQIVDQLPATVSLNDLHATAVFPKIVFMAHSSSSTYSPVHNYALTCTVGDIRLAPDLVKLACLLLLRHFISAGMANIALSNQIDKSQKGLLHLLAALELLNALLVLV
jgi:hypothetical protein